MSTEMIDRRGADDGYGDWVQKSFLMKNDITGSESGIDSETLFARSFTTAMMKFTDTSLGGNLSMNPIPQASLWTDPPPVPYGGEVSNLESYGLQGGLYSEMYDDNQQIVYMRFGVPVFNSFTSFYSRFYDSTYARFVRTGGTSNGIVRQILESFVNFVTIPLDLIPMAFNTIGIISDIVGGAYDWISRRSSSFYYMKPTMPLYWAAAQTILNHIAVNKGFISGVGKDKGPVGNNPNEDNQITGEIDSDERQALETLYSDIISEGNVNLFGAASRAQRLYDRINKQVTGSGDIKEKVLSLYKNRLTMRQELNSKGSLADIWKTHFAGLGDLKEEETKDGLIDEGSFMDKVANHLGDAFKANMKDGAEFVGFRVNHTGAATESFNNSFKDSELAQWINSTSSSARSTKFNMNGGNIIGGPIGDIIGAVGGRLVGLASDTFNSLGLAGLGVLLGNAQADIPKFWDRSDTTFSSKSYTVDLFCPYADDYAQIMYVYAPLAMLLAGALNRSTGRHSYTEPFLCQIFDKGRAQTRLGMIKSMTITRGGSGNVAWTNSHEPLHVRVNFEVEDMESVLHMPIVANYGKGAGAILGNIGAHLLGDAATAVAQRGWFDLENTFIDYMAVLGSLDLTAQIYLKGKWLRKWRVHKANQAIKRSDQYAAMALSNNAIANVARLFIHGTFSR